jgi:hypothetical protein
MEDVERPGEKDWWSDYWLAVTTEKINPEEIRSYWNSNDAPALLSGRERAPQIEIGPLYAEEPDGFDVGPARRIFNVLFLRGTTPEYVLPVVNEGLIAEIMTAALPRGDDQVDPASSPNAIETFLTEHKGWNLVPFERRAE